MLRGLCFSQRWNFPLCMHLLDKILDGGLIMLPRTQAKQYIDCLLQVRYDKMVEVGALVRPNMPQMEVL